MHSFRVGGSSLPTFERSVNKSRSCLSRLDRVPPRSVSVLYSIATGSLVSLFRLLSAFKGGRKRRGEEERVEEKAIVFFIEEIVVAKTNVEDNGRLCPRFHVMQKVGPVCASLRRLVSWRVQLP